MAARRLVLNVMIFAAAFGSAGVVLSACDECAGKQGDALTMCTSQHTSMVKSPQTSNDAANLSDASGRAANGFEESIVKSPQVRDDVASLSDASGLSPAGSDDASVHNPLVGTWMYSGSVPDIITLTITLNADKTFKFSETVAPFTHPAGTAATSCVTTDTYVGTYSETGSNTLRWTVTDATVNAVSRCDKASDDAAGRPLPLNEISGIRDQGLLPAERVTYAATAAALVITPGLGPQPSTTFTKVP